MDLLRYIERQNKKQINMHQIKKLINLATFLLCFASPVTCVWLMDFLLKQVPFFIIPSNLEECQDYQNKYYKCMEENLISKYGIIKEQQEASILFIQSYCPYFFSSLFSNYLNIDCSYYILDKIMDSHSVIEEISKSILGITACISADLITTERNQWQRLMVQKIQKEDLKKYMDLKIKIDVIEDDSIILIQLKIQRGKSKINNENQHIGEISDTSGISNRVQQPVVVNIIQQNQELKYEDKKEEEDEEKVEKSINISKASSLLKIVEKIVDEEQQQMNLQIKDAKEYNERKRKYGTFSIIQQNLLSFRNLPAKIEVSPMLEIKEDLQRDIMEERNERQKVVEEEVFVQEPVLIKIENQIKPKQNKKSSNEFMEKLRSYQLIENQLLNLRVKEEQISEPIVVIVQQEIKNNDNDEKFVLPQVEQPEQLKSRTRNQKGNEKTLFKFNLINQNLIDLRVKSSTQINNFQNQKLVIIDKQDILQETSSIIKQESQRNIENQTNTIINQQIQKNIKETIEENKSRQNGEQKRKSQFKSFSAFQIINNQLLSFRQPQESKPLQPAQIAFKQSSVFGKQGEKGGFDEMMSSGRKPSISIKSIRDDEYKDNAQEQSALRKTKNDSFELLMSSNFRANQPQNKRKFSENVNQLFTSTFTSSISEQETKQEEN